MSIVYYKVRIGSDRSGLPLALRLRGQKVSCVFSTEPPSGAAAVCRQLMTGSPDADNGPGAKERSKRDHRPTIAWR